MADEKLLRAILSLGLDKARARDVRTGVVAISDALDELERQAERSEEAMQALVRGTEILAVSGEQLQQVGRTISAPLQQAAEEYLRYAGRSTAAGRAWRDSSLEIAQAQYQIGRAAATAVVPVMDDVAEVASKAARFASQHPGVIRAALQIGTVVAGLGAVGTAVSRGIRLTADIKATAMAAKQLIASKLMQQAANKQAAAAATMVAAGRGGMVGAAAQAAGAAGAGAAGAGAAGAGAAAGGVTALGVAITAAAGVLSGAVVTDLLAKSEFGERLEEGVGAWLDLLGVDFAPKFVELNKTATVAAYALGDLFGDEEQALRWAASVGELTGAIKDAADETEEAADTIGDRMGLDEAVTAYIDHAREMAQAEEMYQLQITRMQAEYAHEDEQMEREHLYRMEIMKRDFNRDELQAERDFNRSRAMALRDFGREEARILRDRERDQIRDARDFNRDLLIEERDYYRERAEMARDFGIEMQRMEEDHQRQMRYAREDHEGRISELVASRDALAIVHEERQYEKDRRRAEEEYNVEVARRNQDFANQMAQMEAQYQLQREMRVQERDRQLAEQQEQWEYERMLRKEELDLRLADDKEAYDQERSESKAHFNRMLDDTQDEHERERDLREEERDFRAEMDEQQFKDEQLLAEARLADRLRQIDEDTGLLGDRERQIRNAYYEAMVADAEVFMANMRNAFQGGYYYSRQGGGYASYGMYRLGEAGREFVMSSPTTRAAEGLLGGQLSQDALLALLASGGARGGAPGGQSIVVQQSGWTFQGSFSEGDKAWFREAARTEAISAFTQIVGRR